MQALGLRVWEGSAELGDVVSVKEPSVGAPPGELVMAQDANKQVAIGGHAVNTGAG